MSSKTRIAIAALFGATALSVVTPNSVARAEQAESMVVARDASTGLLRNATPAEVKALRAQDVQPGVAGAQPPAAVTMRVNGTRQKLIGERGQVYTIVSRDVNGKLTAQEAIGENAADAALAAPANHPQEHNHADR